MKNLIYLVTYIESTQGLYDKINEKTQKIETLDKRYQQKLKYNGRLDSDTDFRISKQILNIKHKSQTNMVEIRFLREPQGNTSSNKIRGSRLREQTLIRS